MSTDAFDEVLKRAEQLSCDEQHQLIAQLTAKGSGASAPDDEDRIGLDEPRTNLGARLREVRTRIVQNGTSLLSLDQLDAEISERRGGTNED